MVDAFTAGYDFPDCLPFRRAVGRQQMLLGSADHFGFRVSEQVDAVSLILRLFEHCSATIDGVPVARLVWVPGALGPGRKGWRPHKIVPKDDQMLGDC